MYNDIDFNALLLPLKKHKRIMILFVLVFMVLGAVAGFIHISTRATEYDTSATQFEPITSKTILENRDYYLNYIKHIKSQLYYIDRYVAYLSSYALDNENPQILNDKIESIRATLLYDLQIFAENNAILPLSTLENALILQESRVEYLTRKINAMNKTFDDFQKSITNSENSEKKMDLQYNHTIYFNSSSKLYEELLLAQKKYTQLKNTDVLQQNVQVANTMIKETIFNINAIIPEVNSLANQIAHENALIITAGIGVNPRNDWNFDIITEYTHKAPNNKNDVLAFIVFFTLVGIVFSYCFALIKELKK